MIRIIGKLVGRDVTATKSDAKISGDSALLKLAQDDVDAALDIAPHPTLYSGPASLSSDDAFVATIVEQLDPGTWRVAGYELLDEGLDSRDRG